MMPQVWVPHLPVVQHAIWNRPWLALSVLVVQLTKPRASGSDKLTEESMQLTDASARDGRLSFILCVVPVARPVFA